MNGEGAGIALGVNEPVLGAHLLGVFTTIWALYYIAQTNDVFFKKGGDKGACAGDGAGERASEKRGCWDGR